MEAVAAMAGPALAMTRTALGADNASRAKNRAGRRWARVVTSRSLLLDVLGLRRHQLEPQDEALTGTALGVAGGEREVVLAGRVGEHSGVRGVDRPRVR